MVRVKVIAQGSKIRVISEGLELVAIKEAQMKIGSYEIFLSAKGKGKEMEKIKGLINEVKEKIKEIKSMGFCEEYYSLSRRLKYLREKKRELEKIPENELEEIIVEFHLDEKLKIIYNDKEIEIDDIYQELFLPSSLITSLFIVVTK